MPVVSAPPPLTSGPSKTPAARQSKSTKARTDAVGGLWQLAGFGCMVTGHLADAGAISKHAEPITTEIVKLAEYDEKIANVIDKLATVGPYGALITALIPLAAQILVNHNRLPASASMAQLGVIPRAALEAEMRTAIAATELQAQKMQQEAESQLARLKADLEASVNGQVAT